MFHCNAVKRAGVKRLRNVLSKKKRGLAEEHEAAELAASEGAYFKLARDHVSGKAVTRGIYPAKFARVRGANVGINFVVGGSNFELSVSPEHVRRKEHSFVRRRIDLCPRPDGSPNHRSQHVKGLHLASNGSG